MSSQSPWLSFPSSPADPNMRIFCLPYAGGNASVYHAWAKAISPLIQVCPVELPGHGTRLREPLRTSLNELVRDLVEVIAPLLDRPYAVLGHSMGAAIAMQLAAQLEHIGSLQPTRVFVMAFPPLHLPRRHAPLHQLDDEDLIEAIRSFGGTPEVVIQHPEMMEMMLPILRADFQLIETGSADFDRRLRSCLTACSGLQDSEASLSEMGQWRSYTEGSFTLRSYPGNHFFPWGCLDDVIRDIETDLQLD